MTLTNPTYLVDTTFAAKNIASAASVYQYTALANSKVIIEVWATVAGSGDYICYITKQWVGAGTTHVVAPKTTITLGAETDLSFQSIPMQIKTGDVLNVMIDGKAGDINVSGGIRIIADSTSVFEASDTVAAVTTVTTLTNLPAIPNDWLTAAGIKDDAITEIQSGLAQTGGDGDTLETLSDQLDVAQADLDDPDQYKADVSGLATSGSITTLSAIFSGITSLANWLRGLARKDAMDVVAEAELNLGGGTYNEATDSLERLGELMGGVIVFPAGAIEYTYTVTDAGTGNPVAHVEVWISTDLAGVNIIWKGYTDAFGIIYDVLGNKPHLDPGTYYFWRHKVGYSETDPDTEVVS